MFNFTVLPPLGLYIHFPWCVRKCPYCDFNSHEQKNGFSEKHYIDALLSDLDQELPQVWGRPVETIFIGGGTPSLLSPEAMDRLLSELRARLAFTPEVEITLEANPGTAEYEKFSEYRHTGINRLSIGIQSFNDDLLNRIGRIHSGRESIRAAEMAHAAGFENFNLDLMFGLPNQSLKQALADINNAIDLEPSHISYYQLTLEPNTLFHQQPPVLPSDDLRWTMHTDGQTRLAETGFIQYEVSAYAKHKKQCQHNLNYWKFGDYLGIGPGAHGKITDPHQQTITRRWKLRHPDDYQKNATTAERIAGESVLSRKDVALEFMMNTLRLTEGFPSRLFSEHAGLPLHVVQNQLKEAEEKGFIQWGTHTISPTEKGRLFLNELLELFLPEDKK